MRFLERGRSDFLRLCGIHHAELAHAADPYAFAVTRLEVAFRRAAKVDDALIVRTVFAAVKGPRLMIDQQIVRGDDLIIAASVEAVCMDLAGRARRPPAAMVAAVSPLLPPSP